MFLPRGWAAQAQTSVHLQKRIDLWVQATKSPGYYASTRRFVSGVSGVEKHLTSSLPTHELGWRVAAELFNEETRDKIDKRLADANAPGSGFVDYVLEFLPDDKRKEFERC